MPGPTDTSDADLREDAPLPALPADRVWPRPWMPAFFRSLSLIPDVTSACRVARVSRDTAYEWRKKDEEFSSGWDEAMELAYGFVERQLHTWITTGVPVKTVRTVRKRRLSPDGTVLEVTEETFETESAERSAQLMKFWLQAWKPERYRWSERVAVGGDLDAPPIRLQSIEEIDREIAQLAAELSARGNGEPVPVE